MKQYKYNSGWVNPLLELERVNLQLQIEMKQKNLEKINFLGGQTNGEAKSEKNANRKEWA